MKTEMFMKKSISTLILVLFCFIGISPAQEIKGIWAGVFEADDVLAAIRISFDESKIILSFAGDERSGAIKDVKFENGEVSFTAEMRPAAKFVGKIANGKIDGTFDIFRSDGSKSGSGIWNARKVESLDFKDDAKQAETTGKLELPKPSGKFQIGRKFYFWTDESRDETITDDPKDKRKLFVQLWYPAQTKGKIAAEYYPNLSELQGKNDSNDFLASVKTHAFTDAEIAASNTKFPVIIFSPGLGSSPFSYAAIIENLVSRGYVVAAINHPYDSGDFKFSDGEIIRFDSEKWDRKISEKWTSEQRKQFFDERRFGWATDISFVVDQLEKLPSPFKNRLDLQNLGVLGHSFGGQAATIACASDARFKACANLDGMAQGNVFLPNEKGEVLKQPFLFFNKSAEVNNAELKMMNLTREEYRVRERNRLATRWKPSFKNRLTELESGAYFALYPGINHSSFSDSILLNTKLNDPLFADRKIIAENINQYITAFFDKFLMKKKNVTLLEPSRNPRRNVILEFLKRENKK